MIIFFLFSISLIPESIGFNFTFELRPLIFAVFATGMTVRIGVMEWWNNGLEEPPRSRCDHPSLQRREIKSKFKFVSIDVAYIAVTILTIISFVTKTQNINAFHFVFVAIGMFVVYFVVRTANLDEILLQSKIIYSVVGIGFVVAVMGSVQFAMGKPVVSTFGRTSFLGCFLAMNVPLAFGLLLATTESKGLSKVKGRKVAPACAGRLREGQKLFALLVFVVILGVTVLTKSRSAIIALIIVLPMMILATKARRLKEKKSFVENQNNKRTTGYRLRVTSIICALMAVFLMFAGGRVAYKLRPMSASGRVLIWKVSAEMFKKNPITGVGFGNFANYYNLYQADYLASGKGTIVNKMTAGQIRHAYNWYLETAAEFGVFGLLVFGIFWWLILAEIFKTFKPPACAEASAGRHKGHKGTEDININIQYEHEYILFHSNNQYATGALLKQK